MPRSLESKWNVMKHHVSKFIKVHAHVVALNISGTSMCNLEWRRLWISTNIPIYTVVCFYAKSLSEVKCVENVKRSILANTKKKVPPLITPNVELDE